MSQSFFSSSTTHEYRFPFLSQGFQRELHLSFATCSSKEGTCSFRLFFLLGLSGCLRVFFQAVAQI